ncbi:hypothetical protein [Mycobacterium sp. IS-2888]|uniref:hypothetical protein n=1 Tax=Mycobacterium sp. IS-2888 TaxID=1834159 RepID=UPI00096FF2E9|nr:hypothetical protein [Mycobacterium sp. IS-2888]OMC47741.1 hypothetical protein A5744_06720 [Mycobacterium sp. IS-1264]
MKLVNNALFVGRTGLLAEAIRLGGRLATSRVLNIVLASRHWSRPPAKIRNDRMLAFSMRHESATVDVTVRRSTVTIPAPTLAAEEMQ